MLKIKTKNGDTLIHADQQPDAMKLTATDGSQVVVHAGAWGRHKYIRKEGNRYIYPEDLQRGKEAVSNFGRSVVDKAKSTYKVIASTVNNETEPVKKTETNKNTQSKKDASHEILQTKRSVRLNNAEVARHYRLNKAKIGSKEAKEMDQIRSSHNNSFYDEGQRRKDEKWYTSRKTGNKSIASGITKEAGHLGEMKKKTADRKERKERYAKLATENSANISAQKSHEEQERKVRQERIRKEKQNVQNAHQGYSEWEKKQKEAKKKSSDEEMTRSKETESKKRPKSRTRNVINGSVKIKKGASVKTNGPVGSR